MLCGRNGRDYDLFVVWRKFLGNNTEKKILFRRSTWKWTIDGVEKNEWHQCPAPLRIDEKQHWFCWMLKFQSRSTTSSLNVNIDSPTTQNELVGRKMPPSFVFPDVNELHQRIVSGVFWWWRADSYGKTLHLPDSNPQFPESRITSEPVIALKDRKHQTPTNVHPSNQAENDDVHSA